jgi:hypothetical protein
MRVGAPADLVQFRVESGSSGLRIERILVRGREWS